MLKMYDNMGKLLDYEKDKIYSCINVGYIISENDKDEELAISILSEHQDSLCENMNRLKTIRYFATQIDADSSAYKDFFSKYSYPHIWIYSEIADNWVLMDEILYKSTTLNDKIKPNPKSKTEIKNQNSI